MSNQTKNEHGSGGALLILLGALVVLMPMLIAFMAAAKGASYRTVKLLAWPVAWFFSQVIATVVVFVTALFIVGMLFGNSELANYITSRVMDWNMATTVFNEAKIPHGEILIYQLVVWMVLVRPLARHFAISLIDGAICFGSGGDPIVAINTRRAKVLNEPAYHRALSFYANKKPPMIGLFLVMGSPIPISVYY